MLTFVWAESKNGVMGKDGSVPWYLPADLKFFKEITMTGDMLMGRVTFDSFPKGALPGRKNYVMTRNTDYERPGAIILHSKDEALAVAKESDKPLHIIGGPTIFKQFLREVDVLYRTVLHKDFDGDTHVPEIDYSQFELVEEWDGPLDEKNTIPHTYQKFVRK